MSIQLYDKIILRDGREGTVVDRLGDDYIVDVGKSPEDWDTIIVSATELKSVGNA